MLQIIVDRLKDKAPALPAVETAENLDALEKGTAPRSGTTFVLPFRERPEPTPYGAGAFRQLVHVQFLTALIIRRYDDATGGKKVSMFDTLKGEIEQALAGWAPLPESELVEMVAGQAAPLGNGVTAYVQTWQTTRNLEIRT